MLKKVIKTILASACSLAILFGCVTPASAASTYTRYVIANSLNIRSACNTKSDIVGILELGDEVTCYGVSGNWTKIKVDKKVCYISSAYLDTVKPEAEKEMYVAVKTLNIRSKASLKGAVIGQYKQGDKISCYGDTEDGWTKVLYEGKYSYVASEYLTDDEEKALSTLTVSTNESGNEIAQFALQYVGNPYSYGGTSLTNGTDCSGFTLAVYACFGYSLPHSSVGQRTSGTAVKASDRQPGDLICYNYQDGNSHVGIYIGDNKVVHAGSSRTGIHVSEWNYRSVNCVRRVISE